MGYGMVRSKVFGLVRSITLDLVGVGRFIVVAFGLVRSITPDLVGVGRSIVVILECLKLLSMGEEREDHSRLELTVTPSD